jgi:hypothetical protein
MNQSTDFQETYHEDTLSCGFLIVVILNAPLRRTRVGSANFWGESDVGVYIYGITKLHMGIHVLETGNVFRIYNLFGSLLSFSG